MPLFTVLRGFTVWMLVTPVLMVLAAWLQWDTASASVWQGLLETVLPEYTFTSLWLCALVAIGVALNIMKEGIELIWRSSQGLMDEAVDPNVLAEIHAVLQGFEHMRGEVEIIRFDHITTRQAGQRRFVDMHMQMPASWSLGRAAALRTSVEQALMSAVPGLRATIQLLPSDVEAHFDDVRDLK